MSNTRLVLNPLLITISATLTAAHSVASEITVGTDVDFAPGTHTDDCTLRDAVIAANTGSDYGGCTGVTATADTIVFDPALSGATITLAYGQMTITNSLYIQGQNAPGLTIDADGFSRHFEVDFSTYSTLQLHLSDLMLVNGYSAAAGGSIRMYAIDDTDAALLRLERMILLDNQADGHGGAIDFATNLCLDPLLPDSLIIIDSVLSGNTTGPSSSLNGGGVHFQTWSGCGLVIAGTDFENNQAHFGGGLYASSDLNQSERFGMDLSLTDSRFGYNQAYSGGGAVIATGGPGQWLIEDVDFHDNLAQAVAGGLVALNSYSGNWQGPSVVTVERLSVHDNQATNSGGLLWYLDNQQMDYPASLSIHNLLVTGNHALNMYGGAKVDLRGVDLMLDSALVTGNSTDGTIGGLMVRHVLQTALIENSVVRDNSAAIAGGGLFTTGDGDFLIKGLEISGNSAPSFAGLFVDSYPGRETVLLNSTISGNVASGNFGGIYAGGFNDQGSLVLASTTVANNQAADYAGVHVEAIDCQVINSIVSGNGDDDDVPAEISGPTCGLSYSLLGETTNSSYIDDGGNLLGVDPQLAPLSVNYAPGTTLTHALAASSPAINAGDPNFSPPPYYDQRGPGFARVVEGRIDIGAYERQLVPQLDPVSVDFGTLSAVGSGQSLGVDIYNPGTSALEILAFGPFQGPDAARFGLDSGSCGSGIVLDPLTSCSIEINFLPDDRGAFLASLPIAFDGPTSPVSVSLSGTGIAPGIARTPFLLDFSNVLVGTDSAPLPLSLENTGDEALTVSGLAGLSPPFALVSGGSCDPLPFEIDPQESCTLHFRFSPAAVQDSFNNANVQSNALDGDDQFVLTGRGVGANIFQDRFEPSP